MSSATYIAKLNVTFYSFKCTQFIAESQASKKERIYIVSYPFYIKMNLDFEIFFGFNKIALSPESS